MPENYADFEVRTLVGIDEKGSVVLAEGEFVGDPWIFRRPPTRACLANSRAVIR